jgi:hypothetical protein
VLICLFYPAQLWKPWQGERKRRLPMRSKPSTKFSHSSGIGAREGA